VHASHTKLYRMRVPRCMRIYTHMFNSHCPNRNVASFSPVQRCYLALCVCIQTASLWILRYVLIFYDWRFEDSVFFIVKYTMKGWLYMRQRYAYIVPHTHKHTHILNLTHAHMHTHAHTTTDTRHAHIHILTHARIHMYIYVYLYEKHIHSCVCIYICIVMYTYIYIHT